MEKQQQHQKPEQQTLLFSLSPAVVVVVVAFGWLMLRAAAARRGEREREGEIYGQAGTRALSNTASLNTTVFTAATLLVAISSSPTSILFLFITAPPPPLALCVSVVVRSSVHTRELILHQMMMMIKAFPSPFFSGPTTPPPSFSQNSFLAGWLDLLLVGWRRLVDANSFWRNSTLGSRKQRATHHDETHRPKRPSTTYKSRYSLRERERKKEFA